ncbi:hypothetical protein HDU86_005562 [Geranomyces michiganensis]|nr:hypothetical protein HDU86_005562 [Geranomyces michiganensis]
MALRFFALLVWAEVTCAQIWVRGFASSTGIPLPTSTDDSYEYIPIQDSYRVSLQFNALAPAGTITFTWRDENNAVVATSTETVTALLTGVFNTPTLPVPSSWPAQRILRVAHSSGISADASLWLYDLASGATSLYALPPLISAKIGTGAWVSVFSHRYFSPPFVVAPGATIDFAIGNLVTRDNPVALGTTSSQIPRISIYQVDTRTDTRTLVPSSISVTPAGTGYYSFSWTIPASGTYEIGVQWGEYFATIIQAGPSVPRSTYHGWNPAYVGVPIVLEWDYQTVRPLSDLPIQRDTRTISLISYEGNTIAYSSSETVTGSGTFRDSDPAPSYLSITPPSNLAQGFYYLKITYASSPNATFLSSWFRLNGNVVVTPKINGVAAGGSITLTTTPTVTWTTSGTPARSIFGDRSDGVGDLAVSVYLAAGALRWYSLVPFVSQTCSTWSDFGFIGIFYQTQVTLEAYTYPYSSGGSYSTLFASPTWSFTADKSFTLTLTSGGYDSHGPTQYPFFAPGSVVVFTITPIDEFAMPKTLPTLTSFSLKKTASSVSQTISCTVSGLFVDCTLPADSTTTFGPFLVSGTWSSEGEVIDVPSTLPIGIVPSSSSAAVAVVSVNRGKNTTTTNEAKYPLVITNISFDLLKKRSINANVTGTDVENGGSTDGGQFQLFCNPRFLPTEGQITRVQSVSLIDKDTNPPTMLATEATAANTFLVGSPAVTKVWMVAMTNLSVTNPTKWADDMIQPQYYRGQPAQIRWIDSTSSSQTAARQALAAGVTVTLRGLTSNVAYAVAASAWSYVNTNEGLVLAGNFTVECGYSRGLYRLSAYYTGAPRYSVTPLEPKPNGRYSVDFAQPIEIVANAPAGPLCTSADAAEGSAPTIPNDGYVLPFSSGLKTRAVSLPVIALSMLAAIACALF